MDALCTVLAFSEMLQDFSLVSEISLASENSTKISLYSEIFHFAKIAKFFISLKLRNFRYCSEKFLSSFLLSNFFNQLQNFNETAKINTRKIRKICRKVKINLKTRIN